MPLRRRIRAAEVLSAMNKANANRDERYSDADALAASFRGRRRALLRGIVVKLKIGVYFDKVLTG